MSEPAKFDAYAEIYEELHATSVAASGESPEYFAGYKRDCLVRARVPSDQPLLDYGCGTGNLTAMLVSQFADVHGFDVSSKSVTVAAGRIPGARFHTSRETLSEATYATVVLSCVLHHVVPADQRELLAFLRSRLVPGGRLVVFEHNALNPLTRRAVAACPFDDDAILLSPRLLRRNLEALNFHTVKTDYIVFFPKALRALRGLEPRLRWLPLGAQWMLTGTRP